MKKHLLHLFMLLVALSVSPTINADVTFTVDGIQYSYKIHNDAVEVGRNEGFVGDAVIKYMVKYRYKSYDVTAVGLNAFENCKGLTSIELPKSVLKISNNAFKNCDGLTSVEIPNTVTDIARGAFCDCNSLLEINVAEGNENYTSYDGVLYNTMVR